MQNIRPLSIFIFGSILPRKLLFPIKNMIAILMKLMLIEKVMGFSVELVDDCLYLILYKFFIRILDYDFPYLFYLSKTLDFSFSNHPKFPTIQSNLCN